MLNGVQGIILQYNRVQRNSPNSEQPSSWLSVTNVLLNLLAYYLYLIHHSLLKLCRGFKVNNQFFPNSFELKIFNGMVHFFTIISIHSKTTYLLICFAFSELALFVPGILKYFVVLFSILLLGDFLHLYFEVKVKVMKHLSMNYSKCYIKVKFTISLYMPM